jgi:hypothetical protein
LRWLRLVTLATGRIALGVRDKAGMTSLDYAEHNGHSRIVKLLWARTRQLPM